MYLLNEYENNVFALIYSLCWNNLFILYKHIYCVFIVYLFYTKYFIFGISYFKI